MSEEGLLLADLIKIFGKMNEDKPLYQQLCDKLRKAIMQGLIHSGARLPSSRALAKSLGVSRNTVVTVFDQLMAEGLLCTQHGSGTYVKHLNLQQKPQNNLPENSLRISNRIRTLKPSQENAFTLGGEPLLPGFVDQALFPYRQWNKLFTQYNKSIDTILPHVDLNNGYMPLCQALSNHLAITRAVSAQPHQIFITAGAAQSVTLISKVLTDPDDVAWVEEPGYPMVGASLAYADLQLELVTIDHEGMNPTVNQLESSKPRLISTTTSYQFPLGFTMPVSRRLELLAIAREKQAWIIEDDYDGEFRYKGQPIPSLFSLENNHQTIYMGTFSKTLSPSLRINFIVVPPQLVESFQQVYPTFGNFSSMATQAALAEFISRGYFARHIEHMRKVYGARRRALEAAIDDCFDIGISQEDFNPGGLHITLRLDGDLHDKHIAEELISMGIGCLPLSAFYQSDTYRTQGFLLGFTSTDEHSIHESIRCLQKLLSKKGGTLLPIANV